MSSDTDVLIVGAGPTGLMLANQLVRHGVRTTIIDRHAGPAIESRALGVQARTLEIYSHLGIADQAVALGTRATGASIWSGGRRRARVRLSDTGQRVSPYPYLLILGQDDNERLLGEALNKLGLTVRWSTELASLTQEPGHVTATIRNADGSTSDLTASWVAGCDGVRSTVRSACGIPFEGAPYEQVFFVADTEMAGPMVPGQLNVYLWRGGFHLFFPMRGDDHWRIAGILPAQLRDRNDLTFESVIPSVREQAGAAVTFRRCGWFSTYRIHHRRAARFRADRCFVLGDAAHTHSPVGAQGMNTGLQDAYNLGWKLALVVKGRAAPGLLDSYEAERLPVAVRLLSTTDRGFSLVVADARLPSLFRTHVLPNIMDLATRFGWVQKLAFRTISQTGIRYRRSALSVTHGGIADGAPRAGDRFPWLRLRFQSGRPLDDVFAAHDDTRFNLMTFGQAAPQGAQDALGDLLRIHEVPDDAANEAVLSEASIPRPSFYLVRPDGYIGLCGTRLEVQALARYATGPLRLPSTSA